MENKSESLRAEVVAGSLNGVTSLLQERVRIDSIYDDGNSLLMSCILSGKANQKKMLQLLLDNGADISLVKHIGDNVGKNALQIAIEQKKIDLIEIILNKIKSLQFENQSKCLEFSSDVTNALEVVLATGNKELVKTFLDNALSLPVREDANTPFKYRLRAGVIFLGAQKGHLKELIQNASLLDKDISEALANLLSHTDNCPNFNLASVLYPHHG